MTRNRSKIDSATRTWRGFVQIVGMVAKAKLEEAINQLI